MKNIILFTHSSKILLHDIQIKYNVDINEIKNKLKLLSNQTKKKLIKIEYIFIFIWDSPEYKQTLINEFIQNPPIFIPNKNNNHVIISPKKINKYLNNFNISLDTDVKEIISNILYLFIDHLNRNYTHNEIQTIIHEYIIGLIDVDKCEQIDFFVLQEIIIRSILVEITSQNYNKLTYHDCKLFFTKIQNEYLNKIINISYENYKNIILNST